MASIPAYRAEELNREQIKKGEAPYVNPRNTAAGSIRQKDPSVTKDELSFWSYQLGQRT